MNFNMNNGLSHFKQTFDIIYSDGYENFENLPETTSKMSDIYFECSDAYKISGEQISSAKTTNSDSCKMDCLENSNCSGFNLNNKNMCTTFSNIDSLNQKDKNNTLCIKKITGEQCKIPRADIPLPGMSEASGVQPEHNIVKPRVTGVCRKNNSTAFAQLDKLFSSMEKSGIEQIQSEGQFDVHKIKNLMDKSEQDVVPSIPSLPSAPQIPGIISESNMVPSIPSIPSINSNNQSQIISNINNLDSNNININSNIMSENQGQIIKNNITINEQEQLHNLKTESAMLEEQIIQKQDHLRNLIEKERSETNKYSVKDEMEKMKLDKIREQDIQDEQLLITRMEKISSMDDEIEKIRNLRMMMEEQMQKISEIEGRLSSKMSIFDSLNSNAESSQSCPSSPKASVYVDVGCFLNKMKELTNRTDDYMMDLSLLTSNVKSCSYVSKDDVQNRGHIKVDAEGNLVEQVIQRIDIPQPGQVNLDNLNAKVLVSTKVDGKDIGSEIQQVVGMTRENFSNSYQFNNSDNIEGFMSLFGWSNMDLIKIIVLLLIIYFLLVNKKKY